MQLTAVYVCQSEDITCCVSELFLSAFLPGTPSGYIYSLLTWRPPKNIPSSVPCLFFGFTPLQRKSLSLTAVKERKKGSDHRLLERVEPHSTVLLITPSGIFLYVWAAFPDPCKRGVSNDPHALDGRICFSAHLNIFYLAQGRPWKSSTSLTKTVCVTKGNNKWCFSIAGGFRSVCCF